MPLARSEQAELLDRLDDGVSADELVGNLRDIRRANRWLGGTRAVRRAVVPLLASVPHGTPVTLLDVATGSADIPAALLREADRRGWNLRVTASDLRPDVLAAARAQETPRLELVQADARQLAWPEDAFDIVTLSLALHHFEPAEARQVLAEMQRVGRRLLVVNDLERSRAGYAGAWLFGTLLSRNRLTRHDAPLSVRRAYTRQEALALAHAAGWREPEVRPVAFFRYLLTGRPA